MSDDQSGGSRADSRPEPARTWRNRGPRRIKADPGARAWALAVDGVFLGVVVFVVMVVALIASTPVWDVNGKDGSHTQASGLGNASVYALNDTVPTWVSWGIIAILAGLAALISGAFAKPGHRRSLGLVISELRLVRWPVDLEGAFVDDLDDPGTVAPMRHTAAEIPTWDPSRIEPSSGRVAARWLIPFVVFVLLTQPLTGLGAALVVLGGWLPALWGNRRSLYDMVTGVAVVDAVRLAAAAADARRNG